MRPDDLPELGVVKTATPCSAKWDQMEGDDARRFCKKCELYVYDFSALTTNDARELLLQTEGRLCARIFTRADGTVLTKDCPVGLSRKKWKRVGGAAVAAALLGAVINSRMAAKSTCPPAIKSGNPYGGVMMGGMKMPARTDTKKL